MEKTHFKTDNKTRGMIIKIQTMQRQQMASWKLKPAINPQFTSTI